MKRKTRFTSLILVVLLKIILSEWIFESSFVFLNFISLIFYLFIFVNVHLSNEKALDILTKDRCYQLPVLPDLKMNPQTESCSSVQIPGSYFVTHKLIRKWCVHKLISNIMFKRFT